MVQVGSKPEPLRVLLTRGSDFHDVITAAAADFDGAAPQLVFGDLAFESVLLEAGTKADFTILAADVETLAVRQDRTVTLEHLGRVIAKGRFEVL